MWEWVCLYEHFWAYPSNSALLRETHPRGDRAQCLKAPKPGRNRRLACLWKMGCVLLSWNPTQLRSCSLGGQSPEVSPRKLLESVGIRSVMRVYGEIIGITDHFREILKPFVRWVRSVERTIAPSHTVVKTARMNFLISKLNLGFESKK